MKYFLGAEAADPNANTDADQRDNLTEFHSGTNPARFPTTLYVDDDAPPGGDGSSWNHAFPTLQDALCRISDGDVVHIAGGTYKPDLSSNGVFPILDRSATFYLTAGTVLAGGFAGLDNLLDPDMQDIENHETIFTGDLTGDDAADKPQTDDNANNVRDRTRCPTLHRRRRRDHHSGQCHRHVPQKWLPRSTSARRRPAGHRR